MSTVNVSASEMAKGNGKVYSKSQAVELLLETLGAQQIDRTFHVGREDGVWYQTIMFRAGSSDVWQLSAKLNKLGYWTYTATRNGQQSTTHRLFRSVGVWL